MLVTLRRWMLAPLVLIALGWPAWGANGVKDGAGLFKDSTRVRADEAIEEIHRRTHKDLLIETVNTLSPDELKEYRTLTTDAERADFFANFAGKQAHRWDVDGVYVLLCRVPAVEDARKGLFHFIPRRVIELLPPQVAGRAIAVTPPSNDAYFPADARKRLNALLGEIRDARLTAHDQDKILLEAVNLVGGELEANARALGAPPPNRMHWTDVAGAAAALLGLWALLAALRARIAKRDGAPAPGASQGMTVLFGAAGALWLYQAYQARRRGAAVTPQSLSGAGEGPGPDGDDIADQPTMHPDDREAIGRTTALWAHEESQARTGQDVP